MAMDGSTSKEQLASEHGPAGAQPRASEGLAARDGAMDPDASTVDASDDGPPAAMPGLDMRLQWNAVHTRLFGRPPEEHRIGRYLVQGTLGQGGMGKVLRAHDETLGRDVALKVLHDTLGGRHEQRLLREAQALARLSHPNIVRVYDVAEIDGRVCMAMELVEGTTLHQWQQEPRPWREVLDVYLQAGRGLAAAHAEGLVHRDFKPANCILDAKGVVKVLDFGLARGVGGNTGPHAAVELDTTGESARVGSGEQPSGGLRSQRALEQVLTRTGAVLGTLAYMAPEQLMGRPAEPRSDQFAFCVALHQALYGMRPFPGKSAAAILHTIHLRRVDPQSARAGLPPVPKWLHEVVRRGLSVASHQRWPDMAALLGTVERRLARRRRIRGAALGVVLLAGLGGTLSASGVFDRERPCEGLREQGMPAWTEADRAAVDEALEAAAPAELAVTPARVRERLDAYAEAWIESRVDACEATWERRTATETLLVRRTACLDDRAARVRAVVDRLASADARTVAFASEAVEELPDLHPCEDQEELLRGPEPVPEALAEEAAKVRELVARSWALGATGDGEHGLEAADRAVAAAEAFGEAPTLRLDALHNQGHLLRMARRWSEARRALETALELAEQLEDSTRATDALAELVLLAEDEEDVSAAGAWLGAIRGKLSRLDDQPRRVAQRWWLEGLVELASGRSDAALEAAQHAVEAYEQVEPPVDRERIEAYLLLGDVLHQRDDHAKAREAYDRALALAEAGGDLPAVAQALYRLGRHHYFQGEPEAARTALERSLALREVFYGPHAAASIRTRLLLAAILYFQGQLPRAVAQVSVARQSLDERVPPQLRGEVLEMAGMLHRARAEWDEAIASYREAGAAWRSVPSPNRVDLAVLDGNIADCLVAEGEHRAARSYYDDALATLDVVAPEDPERAYPLLGRGKLLLEQGAYEDAARDLRAALALQGHLPPDPARDAELRWALGRALRPDARAGREPTQEAAMLVREARARFVEIEQGERAQEIDAWLERCGTACASPR